MAAPVELIALNCIRCGFSIPAATDEAAWVCRNCGQAQRLHPAEGLLSLDIHYADGIIPPKKGRPFWVCEGQVALDRKTYSSIKKRTGQAEAFWSQPKRFYIPAFTFALEEFTRLGLQWLSSQPELKPGQAADFEPVTIMAEDTRAWAEFLVVALEAERKDKVKELGFDLKLAEPQLWVLP